MLKKDITFTNLDGEEITETFYFHLSKLELIEMEVEHPGGLVAYLTQIAEAQDGPKVMAAFREIIAKTIGRRTDDGRFVKHPAYREEFMSSDAYSELVFQFFTDANAAVEFVNAVVPVNLQEAAKTITKETVVELPQEEEPKKFEDYTDDELFALPVDEFKKIMDSFKGGNVPRRLLTVAIRRRDL